ncbi:MAG: hypothetical protein ABIE92_08185 [bacterium]
MRGDLIDTIQQEAKVRKMPLTKERCRELHEEWHEKIEQAAEKAALEIIQERLDQYWIDQEDEQLK